MSREIRLAEIIIKYEKGVKERPVTETEHSTRADDGQIVEGKQHYVIGYCCRVPLVDGRVPDLWWSEEVAYNELITSLQVASDKLSTTNSTKVAWATLSDEIKACVLAVVYLSASVVRPADVKDLLTALANEDEVSLGELMQFIRKEQPKKLVQRLKRAIKQEDILSYYGS